MILGTRPPKVFVLMYTAAVFFRLNIGRSLVDVMVFLSEQWILVSILGALATALFVFESRRGGKALSLQELTRLVNKDEAVVVDVREKKEYKAGHIVDAIHIAHQKLASRLSELEKHKSKIIIVVDKAGQHTGAAVKVLKDAGFSANRMQGGMAEWTGQNLPVVKD